MYLTHNLVLPFAVSQIIGYNTLHKCALKNLSIPEIFLYYLMLLFSVVDWFASGLHTSRKANNAQKYLFGGNLSKNNYGS